MVANVHVGGQGRRVCGEEGKGGGERKFVLRREANFTVRESTHV